MYSLRRIKDRYDPENDTHYMGPPVTWDVTLLVDAIEKLEGKIEKLEKRIDELENGATDEENPYILASEEIEKMVARR